ncbi:hypothetical protein RRG08_018577 [Elysia crispata]|uniref:Uncharacterized protein n=1 Tax=Elysia crispata TaxID=231223 RepID=A0AAE0Y016_9GAST|nr:hypothetical protein RRG08_018577 [Elysia crispata]
MGNRIISTEWRIAHDRDVSEQITRDRTVCLLAPARLSAALDRTPGRSTLPRTAPCRVLGVAAEERRGETKKKKKTIRGRREGKKAEKRLVRIRPL